ncbi:MAG: phosphoenolpyruvate carboxylase [Verrucomicrobiota bacterium]
MKDTIQAGFDEIETLLGHAIATLTDIVGPETKLAQLLQQASKGELNEAGHEADPVQAAQLSAVYFELLNLIEETVAARMRRERQSTKGLQAVKGLWGEAFQLVGANQGTEQKLLDELRAITVEPVLTAHPTEAKRATVRERHRAIYEALTDLADTASTDTYSRSQALNRLQAALETLWHAGEIRDSRPTITDELQNILFYLREVFPRALKEVDDALKANWAALGRDPHQLYEHQAFPQVQFGTWVGGDRDGHPFVTAEVTHETLQTLRTHSRELYRRLLHEMAREIPLSPPFADFPEKMAERRDQLAAEFPEASGYLLKRNQTEPWRQFVYLVREKVRHEHADGGYLLCAEFDADLAMLEKSLCEAGAPMAAREFVHPIRRVIETFGFRLAKLDIRQNSDKHEKAFLEILIGAGLTKEAEFYQAAGEDDRMMLILKELSNPRPLTARGNSLESNAQTVLSSHRVVAKHLDAYGPKAFGSLIVSMTRGASDLLLVHLLGRESGLSHWKDGYWCARLPVCPLLEQYEDLIGGADIMRAYLATKPAKNSPKVTTSGRSVAPVMIGYSDSNKDAGVLASQFALWKGQTQLTEIGTHGETEIEFFHGRGGTISRGAGPTKWFLRSLPTGSLGGSFRLTEQGESIPQKYANLESAAYHLESLLAGAFLADSDAPSPSIPEAEEVLEQLAEYGRTAYRGLLEKPGFVDFYCEATPIDALERGMFGSRPARRTGTQSLDDLRAIPWVFSWTQSRFYLPGWFSVGSALSEWSKSGDLGNLRELTQKTAFLKYLFNNIETNLVSANPSLMKAYASLVQDPDLRETFMTRILTDYEQARSLLGEILPGKFEDRRPRMAHTLQIRSAMLERLHHQQVDLLQEWRSAENDAGDELIGKLLFNVNAVASGLRTTG